MTAVLPSAPTWRADSQALSALLDCVEVRSSHGIAVSVAMLIRSGRLAPGSRLPTVRATAAALHVSATTVNGAWRYLAQEGLVRSAGRSGTVVLNRRSVVLDDRARTAHWMAGRYATDLASGTPDPQLLPDLTEAIRTVAGHAGVASYTEPATLPELEEWIRDAWSDTLEPQDVLVTDGAFDAIDRLLRDRVRLGDRVLVEGATMPSLLDMILRAGGVPVPLACDDQGPRPDAVVEALRSRPVAAVLQPRAQNPTGRSTSPARTAQLGAMFAGSSVLVIEDDHTGQVAWAPHVSIHRWHPTGTVHVQSFSKSHGPDLRLAAVGGPRDVLDQVQRRRAAGPGWSSRLLQRTLLELLHDPRAGATVASARHTYRRRSQALIEALARHGLEAGPTDGLNLWVRVARESEVARRMGEHGVGVAPGTPFHIHPPLHQHVRITCAALAVADAEQIAALVAGHL